MSKKHALFKNTLIIAIGNMSRQLASFALLPLFTLFLSPAQLGTIDLVTTYVALLTPVITIQMELAIFRYLIDSREDNETKNRIITTAIAASFVAFSVFLILVLCLSLFINVKYLDLIVVYGFSSMLFSMFANIARGLGENKKYAIANIVTAVASLFFVSTTISVFKAGTGGVVMSLALSSLLGAIYLFIKLKLRWHVSKKNLSYSLFKDMAKYSAPLIPNGLSWWVISASDRTIVTIFLGLYANGIYAVASKYAAILTGVLTIFTTAFAESASMHISNKDNADYFSDIGNISLKFFGALGMLLIAIAPIVFDIAVGKDFYEALNYIPILVLSGFFSSIVGFYSSIYVAKKMTKQVAFTTTASAAINIVLTLIFIKLLGLYAATIATAIAYLAVALHRHYDIKKYVSMSYQKGLFAKVAFAYGLVTALFYLENTFFNLINVIIALIIAVQLNKNTIKIIIKKIINIYKFKTK